MPKGAVAKRVWYWRPVRVAGVGLLIIGVGVFVDWVGARCAGMSWSRDILEREGYQYYVSEVVVDGDREEPELILLSPAQYETRLSWGIVSGVVICIGILILAVGHFGFFMQAAEQAFGRFFPQLLPQERKHKTILAIWVLFCYLLSVGAVSSSIMGAKVSGTSVILGMRPVAEDNSYYAVSRLGGIEKRIKISGSQYETKNRWEQVALKFWFAGLVVAIPPSLFMAIKGSVYLLFVKSKYL